MTIEAATPPHRESWETPDLVDRILAYASILLIALVLTALVRGYADWHRMTLAEWAHLSTVLLGVAIAPVQLLRKRGDLIHRIFGRIWAVLLFSTAVISFAIRDIDHGGLSPIHILSAITIVCVPTMVWAARTDRILLHRGIARGIILGGICIAGFFTLLPSRVLGAWLFAGL
ncbi:MAG: DUF2306 domain-containing protein [Devosia sp.]